MKFDANTITIVIALAAIISPILVAFINNAHNAKMKQLDYEHLEKIKQMEFEENRSNENAQFLYSIYENYLQSASRCIANPARENIKLYGEHYSIAFIYFPAKYHGQLKAVNTLIRNNDWEKANIALENLAINLSDQIKDIMK